MSETVKSLANMYGLTLDEALAALEAIIRGTHHEQYKSLPGCTSVSRQ